MARHVTQIARAVKNVAIDALDAVFPRVCEQAFSLAAEQGFKLDSPGNYCHRCGATAEPSAVTESGCAFCVSANLPWQSLVRLGPYHPTLGQWVTQMKFHHRWPWCEWFGDELSKAITTATDASRATPNHVVHSDALTVVAAVPMHPLRRFQRGFNQSHLIAQRIARAQGWPLAPLLSRSRFTPAQTTVAPSRRGPNVAGSFAMRSNVDLTGATIWLIDDVKTSGSTLVNCARLLRKAGAASVHIAVVAVADPKQANFTQT